MLIPKGISMIFEGLEIQFFNVLIAIAAVVIVYFAWKSTEVRENFNETDLSDIHNNEFLSNIGVAPSLQDVLEEVSNLAMSGATRINSSSSDTHTTETQQNNDNGPQEIIRNMDSTIDEPISTGAVRRRHMPFFTQNGFNENNSSEIGMRRENLNIQATGDSTHAENCSNENNENENISKSESNKNQNDQIKNNGNNNTNTPNSKNNEFVIKLKYLNDDLRLVKGSPEEALGDFKKKKFYS